MNNLKNKSNIKWSSWATITITEFSDMECPYCIKQHNDWTIQNILKNNSWSINYTFKNFPLPKHKNSEKEAIASKCVWKLSKWEKYYSFIDSIFKTTTWWWEWYDLNNLDKEIENIWLNKQEFNSCYNDDKSRKLVADEFNLWIKLWVNSTPTSLIINNKTGEYIMLKWKVWESEFNKAISEVK
jgi:protein-disulfide isomerase